jgi:mycothiol system anti-sigma-R factor
MNLVDRLMRILGVGEGEGTGELRGGGECASCRTISCIEALERVHDYLDGELDEGTAADVAHHFRICQECYPHLKLEERFRDLLRSVQAAERCPEQVRIQILEVLGVEAVGGGGVE